MNSSLYQCRVLHHRLHPKEHRFTNRMVFFRVDLDELDFLDRRLKLFSRNRRNLYSLNDEDFSPPGSETPAPLTLKEKIKARLKEAGMETDQIRVELVAMPRIAGHLFNPVSFYFCHDGNGRPLAAMAEVTNTFREVKTYLIPPVRGDGNRFTLRVPKLFYVSPFSDLTFDFVFSLRAPGKELVVRIDEYEGDRLMLHSLVVGKEEPLNDRALLWFAVRFPFLSLQVLAGIHWQALRLYLKKIPHREKAANPHLQTNLQRPHASLSNTIAKPSSPTGTP